MPCSCLPVTHVAESRHTDIVISLLSTCRHQQTVYRLTLLGYARLPLKRHLSRNASAFIRSADRRCRQCSWLRDKVRCSRGGLHGLVCKGEAGNSTSSDGSMESLDGALRYCMKGQEQRWRRIFAPVLCGDIGSIFQLSVLQAFCSALVDA
ncbi:hypothetical protein BGZ63DRAFT_377885 [Mariannaea sp. PMI_226]|nr:hypothetical protein BGZ63DRAFT_377885 [Mariannaea sp. PMI_226]